MRTGLWPDSADKHLMELDDYFAGNSIDIAMAFVVEVNRKVLAGFLELNVRSFAEGSRNPQVPYIEAWYVRPEYRNNGFGKALIDRAEKWAIDHGFYELASDTDLTNEMSIAVHKHLGYAETERVVCFLKQLVE